MAMRSKMMAVLGLCAVLLLAGCFNPPVERMKSRQAMAAGNYAGAEQRLVACLEHNPADWEAHYLLGKLYLEQDRPVRAQSHLEQALAVVRDRDASQTPKILDAMAEALYQQERYEQLYLFLDEQIDRYEGWEDYARKARMLAKASDIDGAALAYRQAAFFSRNQSADIYVEIAEFYEGLGDYDKAIQALKWAYYIDDEREDLPGRFRQLGVVPGPTLKEQPPQPDYAGAQLFVVPDLLGD